MRADATRNRDALLRAARELFVERGLDVPLDAVARHAGVGPATLYRRFPDREALLHDVALMSLAESRTVALAVLSAVSAATDAEAAERAWHRSLREFAREWVGVHLLIQLRTTSPVEGEAMEQARQATLEAFDRLLAALRSHGLVRPELTSFEVWTLLLSVARPLPGVPASASAPLVHRHLQVVAAGLRPAGAPVLGPAITQSAAEQTAGALAAEHTTGHRLPPERTP